MLSCAPLLLVSFSLGYPHSWSSSSFRFAFSLFWFLRFFLRNPLFFPVVLTLSCCFFLPLFAVLFVRPLRASLCRHTFCLRLSCRLPWPYTPCSRLPFFWCSLFCAPLLALCGFVPFPAFFVLPWSHYAPDLLPSLLCAFGCAFFMAALSSLFVFSPAPGSPFLVSWLLSGPSHAPYCRYGCSFFSPLRSSIPPCWLVDAFAPVRLFLLAQWNALRPPLSLISVTALGSFFASLFPVAWPLDFPLFRFSFRAAFAYDRSSLRQFARSFSFCDVGLPVSPHCRFARPTLCPCLARAVRGVPLHLTAVAPPVPSGAFRRSSRWCLLPL